MEFFVKIVDGFLPLTNFAKISSKSAGSNIDVTTKLQKCLPDGILKSLWKGKQTGKNDKWKKVSVAKCAKATATLCDFSKCLLSAIL